MGERIVVTGMGAITPVGTGVMKYWRNLLMGENGISLITRFDPIGLPVTFAGEIKDFSPSDFLSKKLVKNTDIFMQFALIAAEEALNESELNVAPERIGIVLGTALGGISTISNSQDRITRTGSKRLSPHTVPKMLGNIGAAYIAIAHGLKGPSLSVSTACSAGADAIGMASMLLKTRQADAVVAVGAESIISGLMVAGLSAARALSTQNDYPGKASRPFDLERDGFVMGEGGGAVVLESETLARKRGANIKAELLSYANGTDAYHVTSPEPHGTGEILCMKNALDRAKLAPSDVDYINAHGTSTPVGDSIETLALKSVFGDKGAKSIPVSSTKGATGHLMGGGGVTEFIACIKSIEEGIIPPTLNYENVDPECDLDYVPNHSRKTDVRVAMSNSFGFGGQNATLLVGKYEEHR